MIRRILSASLAVLLLAPGASADPPRTISIQGILLDAADNPVSDGEHTLQIQIYDDPVGGNIVHSETKTVTTVDGLFDTLIGVVPAPLTAPFDVPYWLGLTLDGGTEMTPRPPLTSSPYAMTAITVPDSSLGAVKVAPGELVKSLNGLTDDVTIAGSGGITVSEVGSTLFINGSTGGGSDSDWFVNGDDMYAIPSGEVGIGTTTPTADLHIVDTNTTTLDLKSTAAGFNFAHLKFDQPQGDAVIFHQTTDTSDLLGISGDGDIRIWADAELRLQGDAAIRFQGASAADRGRITADGELEMLNTAGTPTLVLDGQEGASSTQGGQVTVKNDGNVPTIELDGDFGNTNSGNVRVFHSNGNRTIELLGEEAGGAGGGTGGQIDVANDSGTTTVEIDGDFDATDAGNIRLKDAAGNVTVELRAVDGSGQGRVVTDVLEIQGGADLSETFDVRDDAPVLPGTVVSIDPANPGALEPSARAYDRRVAGVVSGAGGVRPGMLMGQRGSVAEGDHPVALTGRVYVRCDASHGAIEPGDLLTTSPTRGHAMRVDDPARASGATLGKAMTRLESGRGLVLVLVALQ